MYPRIVFVSFLILASVAQSPRAAATTYTADCGANGSAAVVQNQVNVIGSTPNSALQVTGTCVGDVRISRADRLTVSAS
jgi:zona occludens toxin (predicted ATPase)